MNAPVTAPPRLLSGVPGLDEVLLGGLPRETLLLVKGPPGSGKTTIALQFLLEAVRRGESCILATNAEAPEQLKMIVASHGWSLDGVHVTALTETAEGEDFKSSDYTLFPEAEVEVGETLQHLFSEIERLRPTLVVLDAISSLRVMAPTPAFYRRQLKRIRDFTSAHSCTTIILDEATTSEKDLRSQTLADGIIELQQLDFNFGADRRRLRVRKLRGCAYHSGAHDFTIGTGGLVVYPRLVAAGYATIPSSAPLKSGIEEIDALVGGGLPRGSATLIIGPAGIGKSTICSIYALAAAKQAERCSMLLFDESEETLMTRSHGLGFDMAAGKDSGCIRLHHLDPAELTPGQIAQLLVRQVEDENVRVVIIDTLNGYLQSAIEEPAVLLQVRELISFLSRRQVVTLLTMTQHGILGPDMAAPVDLSFLADNVFLLRYFEAQGAIRKALSVVKKRSGKHESTIRELILKPGGVSVSEPLSDFTGVLTGTPVYAGASRPKGA